MEGWVGMGVRETWVPTGQNMARKRTAGQKQAALVVVDVSIDTKLGILQCDTHRRQVLVDAGNIYTKL